MRNLQLELPRMIGTDVIDWQKFLAVQGFLTPPPDGVFGPLTAKATRAYHTKAGLDPDGVVGPETLAKAIADGFASVRPFAGGYGCQHRMLHVRGEDCFRGNEVRRSLLFQHRQQDPNCS